MAARPATRVAPFPVERWDRQPSVQLWPPARLCSPSPAPRPRATLRATVAGLPVDPVDLDLLAARLADGDRSAFAAVFRELWPKVRALCVSLLGNTADAEDAAQQAMEKVLTRAQEYDRTRPALAWALAIAAWECRTVARWRHRRREVGEEHVPEKDARAGASWSTEDQFIRGELQKGALAALGQLSDGDQAALVTAYWDEARSGAPTARKRRQRAIERLRLAFRRLYGAD
jgi:RNA polymerase sigma-70 factor, ECF subfamily